MSPFEQQVKDALARRAPAAQPRDASWGEVIVRVSDSRNQRHLAVTALTVAALAIASVGVAIAVPRIGEHREPSTFADPSTSDAIPIFVTATYTPPDGPAQETSVSGDLDIDDQVGSYRLGTYGRSLEEVRVIVTPGHAYVRLPSDTPGIPDGKTWSKSPLDSIWRSFFQLGDPHDPFSPGTDPHGYLERLGAMGSRIHKDEEQFQSCGGSTKETAVCTPRLDTYTVTISLDNVVEALGGSYGQQFRTAMRPYGTDLVVKVHADADRLPYSIAYSGDSESEGRFEWHVQLDHHKVTELRIELPSEEDTFSTEYSLFSGVFGTHTTAEYSQLGSRSCSTNTATGQTSCTFQGRGEPIGSPDPRQPGPVESCTYDPESGRASCSAQASASPAASP